MKKTILMTIALTFISCVQESGRGTRLFTAKGVSTTDCSGLYFDAVTKTQCVSQCESGSHIASTEELATLKESLTEDQNTILDTALGACVEDVIDTSRPSDAISIQGDFCVCQNKKSTTLNTHPRCPTFCNSLSDDNTAVTIYGSVTLDDAVTNNESLGNLHNWCTVPLENDTTNPQCVLTDGSGRNFALTTSSGSNEFQAILSGLPFNKQYVLYIEENATGTSAKTKDTLQVFLQTQTDEDNEDMVRFQTMTQYTCIRRLIEQDQNTSKDYYVDSARSHFYYRASNTPPAIPESETSIFCHDIFNSAYSRVDSALYDRLERRFDHFGVWYDSRFYNDTTGQLYMNTLIKEKYATNTGETLDTNIFFALSWDNAPQVDGISTNSNVRGYLMIPFVDERGFGSCPTLEDYDSGGSLYSVLKEYVKIPTEALYLATGPTETFTSTDGTMTTVNPDVMLVRESEVKDLWFLNINGTPTKPTDLTLRDYTAFFYWPPIAGDTDPYQQKGYQKLYTITEIGEDSSSGIPVGRRPHDKRVACVPAVDSLD